MKFSHQNTHPVPFSHKSVQDTVAVLAILKWFKLNTILHIFSFYFNDMISQSIFPKTNFYTVIRYYTGNHWRMCGHASNLTELNHGRLNKNVIAYTDLFTRIKMINFHVFFKLNKQCNGQQRPSPYIIGRCGIFHLKQNHFLF